MRLGVMALSLFLPGVSVLGQSLFVTGQGDHLWVVRPESDQQSFTLLHRHISDAPGSLRLVRQLHGRLARGGMATDGNRLWLIYDSKLVQSLRGSIISAGGPSPPVWHWSTRIEPSLPTGVHILCLAADRHGPWALLRVDTLSAWRQIGRLSFDQSPPAPAAATQTDLPPNLSDLPPTSSAVADVGDDGPDEAVFVPADCLLRLERTWWKKIALPAEWEPHAGAWVVMSGPGRDVPVLVQWLSGTDGGGKTATDNRLRLHRMTTPPGMDEPVWESSEEFLPGAGAVQVLGVDGQAVAGQRINQPQGIGIQLFLLRPEGTLALGVLSLPDVDAGAAWTLAAAERSVALIVRPDPDRWLWTTMNLRGQVAAPPTELREKIEHPFNQILNHLVLVIVLVVATLMMFVFWKRPPLENQIRLPKGMSLANFSTRAMAGIIDLSPCAGVAFAYFSVDWFTGLGQWPGRASGMESMLPGAMAIGLYVLHTGLAELFTGRTLGKMICGLRVVDFRGRPPHLWQVLGRNALKTLDLIAWPLLILPIISPQRQRLGDMVAGTLVVMLTPPEPPDSSDSQDSRT